MVSIANQRAVQSAVRWLRSQGRVPHLADLPARTGVSKRECVQCWAELIAEGEAEARHKKLTRTRLQTRIGIVRRAKRLSQIARGTTDLSKAALNSVLPR